MNATPSVPRRNRNARRSSKSSAPLSLLVSSFSLRTSYRFGDFRTTEVILARSGRSFSSLRQGLRQLGRQHVNLFDGRRLGE